MVLNKLLLPVLLFCVTCAATVDQPDEISGVFEGTVKGQAAGIYLDLRISIERVLYEAKYSYIQTWFIYDAKQKKIIVTPKCGFSDENLNCSVMKNVRWIPGKQFVCEYYTYDGNEMVLIATKKAGKAKWDFDFENVDGLETNSVGSESASETISQKIAGFFRPESKGPHEKLELKQIEKLPFANNGELEINKSGNEPWDPENAEYKRPETLLR